MVGMLTMAGHKRDSYKDVTEGLRYRCNAKADFIFKNLGRLHGMPRI